MSQRVLATEEAQNAISQIRGILDGGFEQTISTLKSLGNTLSEPNVWDGSLAVDFRSNIWPQCTAALDKTLQQLNELHSKLVSIQSNIMQAGGNQ